jgi:hypothetical protein
LLNGLRLVVARYFAEFGMHRIFLGLAATNSVFLLVTFIFGFVATAAGGARATDRAWMDLHFLLGLFSTITTVLVHSIVFTYFLGTGKWVKEVSRVYGLPGWVWAQAIKNKRKAFPVELWGMALIGIAAWMGAGAHARGWRPEWHLGLAAVALAFNSGAFVIEYVAIVSQARLLLEVKEQADFLRLQSQTKAKDDRSSGPLTEL